MLCLYAEVTRVSVLTSSCGWSDLLTPTHEVELPRCAKWDDREFEGRLIVQDRAEEVAMDCQRAVAVVID